MARAGRKPQGWKLIEGLGGDAQGKARLIAVLQTLAGERTVKDVCQELGIQQSRFFEMRTNWLHEARDLLSPKRVGRPPHEQLVDPQVRALEARISELQQQVAAAELRAKLAEMRNPTVARAEKDGGKKNAPR